MHPLIRILCLLVFAALAPWLPPPGLLVAAILLMLWGLLSPLTGQAMLRGLRRIRWLLLSVAILYLWFSPGEPLLPLLGSLSPTDTGLALALQRAGVLLVMLWAAAGVVANTGVPGMTAALRQLLTWPVRTRAGARFADRIGLLLAELPMVEERVRASLAAGPVRGVAERAATLFMTVENGAAERPFEPEAQPLAAVPNLQKLLPAAMLLAGLAVIFLS